MEVEEESKLRKFPAALPHLCPPHATVEGTVLEVVSTVSHSPMFISHKWCTREWMQTYPGRLSYPALCSARWSQTAKVNAIKLENKLQQLIFIEVIQIKPKESLSSCCLSELRSLSFSCLPERPLSDNLPAVLAPSDCWMFVHCVFTLHPHLVTSQPSAQSRQEKNLCVPLDCGTGKKEELA